MKRALAALALSMIASAPLSANERIVTVYAAPGLHNGRDSWLEKEFAAYTRSTGVEVRYVEAGAGVIVDRAAEDKASVDILITLPPFTMKAAAEGLLLAYKPRAAHISGGTNHYQPLARNYLSFIYNAASLPAAPKSYTDLLDPKFHHRLQYSTPGEAGDGTAFMLQVFHVFSSKEAGFDYFRRLQVNNVGPSPATGPLTKLVNDARLDVANGDLQMNLGQRVSNPNIRIFWPAGPNGERSTLAMPYYIGIGASAPHLGDAKALVEFLLAKQAQETVVGESARADVAATDADHVKLRDVMKGVAVWSPDWSQVLKDLPADIARWHEATGF